MYLYDLVTFCIGESNVSFGKPENVNYLHLKIILKNHIIFIPGY